MSDGKIELVGVKLPAKLVSFVEEHIEKHSELGYESVEEFVAEAIRKRIFAMNGIEMRSSDRNEIIGTQVNLRKELYELLKEFCEWSGRDLHSYVGWLIFDGFRADIDSSRGIPKGDEFWEKIKKLEGM